MHRHGIMYIICHLTASVPVYADAYADFTYYVLNLCSRLFFSSYMCSTRIMVWKIVSVWLYHNSVFCCEQKTTILRHGHCPNCLLVPSVPNCLDKTLAQISVASTWNTIVDAFDLFFSTLIYELLLMVLECHIRIRVKCVKCQILTCGSAKTKISFKWMDSDNQNDYWFLGNTQFSV